MPTRIRKEPTEISWQVDLLNQVYKGNIRDISEILPLITPGEELRIGLDNILEGEMGGLIVFGENDALREVMRVGFEINVPFSAERMFELAKMDGAIVISNDLLKILYANVHLIPDRQIETGETGIRHRSAEQTAKQTGLPVIAISKRKKLISLFYRDQKYVLQNIGLLIVKANHSISSLREYRERIDSVLDVLTYNELNNSASSVLINEAIGILQKILYFFKHGAELDRMVIELGDQGKDIVSSMYEYEYSVDETMAYILQDYSENLITREKADELVSELKQLDLRSIADTRKLAVIANIPISVESEALNPFPRGYRILSRIPKLKKKTIDKLIQSKKCIAEILKANVEEISIGADTDLNTAKYIKSKLDVVSEKLIEPIFE
ncbi:MAG: DNA integrity scanning diadenylate cyclase DisA [archaeon]|jgi:diadenylate cyclase